MPKEIHAILTETLACFLPGRAKSLSAPLLKACSNGAHVLLPHCIILVSYFTEHTVASVNGREDG